MGDLSDRIPFAIDHDVIAPTQLLKIMKDISRLPPEFQDTVRRRLRRVMQDRKLKPDDFSWRVSNEVERTLKELRSERGYVDEEELAKRQAKEARRMEALKVAKQYMDEEAGSGSEEDDGDAIPSDAEIDDEGREYDKSAKRHKSEKKDKKDKKDKKKKEKKEKKRRRDGDSDEEDAVVGATLNKAVVDDDDDEPAFAPARHPEAAMDADAAASLLE
eukprot:PhM_4_TR3106/c0_g1_i1/m.68610